jgi:outer membrane biogenesis lipoprotein LolB
MKEVAILLLVALLLNGCGTNQAVRQAPGAIWQAQLIGGVGPSSGFSFQTQFTVNSDGTLTIANFQFLNNGSCFPFKEYIPTGAFTDLNIIQSTLAVTGNFSFTVQSGGNTLTLTGPMTGTVSETGETGNNTFTFTSATITGDWTLTGSGTGACGDASGSFTMTFSST